MAAVGQHPERVGAPVVRQAYGAARLPVGPPRLRVQHLRVAFQGRLVDSRLRRTRRRPGAAVERQGRGGGGRGGAAAGAVVGGEGNGGDEEENAHGNSDSVTEAADAFGAEEAAGVGGGAVHDGDWGNLNSKLPKIK
ncbi:hypothetical protein STAS_02593 [Striga asiatica]|uniref:Uncharacterized protein n=1 Tax=Striga asiatica TaxID=4170 RepID=A0A5A7P2D6_STRAF|nr:hypothetical protein STAS_02593 [Striga asiatica]